ncbi:MAG: tRNA dimethylallyltransferase [Actinomycetota bacterium]|nr:tRNA dimethylallyltransferase [Actinomycetota bacterium]
MPGDASPMLALVGPTASGKTEAGIQIAEAFGAEVVSVDSMLIYRGMDIGTAKPSAAQRNRIAHHLMDLAEPSEPFSVAAYQEASRTTFADLELRGVTPLLVGGSGLYFRACVDDLEFPTTDAGTRADLERQADALGSARLYARLQDLDPVAAAKIEPGNVRRTIRALEVAGITGRPFSSFAEAWERYPADRAVVAGVDIDRTVLNERIVRRVDAMINGGWLQEVARLVDAGFGGWLTATQAIGYAELSRHLEGGCSLEEAEALTVKRTKQLARRQLAWFRRDPRVRWFRAGESGAMDAVDDIVEFLGAGR